MLPLYQEAALRAAVFKELFNTFQGDPVTKARLRQRVSDLNVHPDAAEARVDTYLDTMSTARLVSVDGDKIQHASTATPLAIPDTQEPKKKMRQSSQVS